ncbi:hypothetical protein O4J56_06900 [Nocardiopsis sp. RSe5-2]|uniref:FtsK domain-containing protein n=1 Tax=Nocardiopsis endophytica TaxID=3018445 RepID=A0ABT4U086_9ACTN|nr:hypothetical protein [Nocardiopsis endophytica]MDA2810363.1 hypothetical protein [Nocardiopsis endophytica]
MAEQPQKSGKKKSVKKGRVNWSHEQGPLLGAANAASAAMATAAVGSLPEVGMDWWVPAVAGAVGAAASVARAGERPLVSRLFRGARWAGFAGWSAYALANGGPWDVSTLSALGLGTVAAGVMQPVTRSFEIAAEDRASKEGEIKRRAGIAGEWEARINRICNINKPGVQVTDLVEWEVPDPHNPGGTRKTGMSIVVELPAGSSSWRTIAQKAEALAADADLPDGCGIEVASHGSRRRVLLLASTVDALAEDIPAGDDYSPLSIYDDLPTCMHRDGSYGGVNFKWQASVLIGATGSGKSAHLSLIMRQLLRCRDVLVVGIDFNGGKAFKPFLRPWLEGRASRPAIDWVATDPAEAKLMLDFLIDAIPARSSGYADLMAQANDDKVPASPSVPHIQVITDEAADLPREVKSRLVELSNRSRGVSIRQLTCALRAVSAGGDQLPKELIAQAAVRIAMKVNEDGELQRLYGYSKGLPKADEMPAAGYGLLQPDPAQLPRIMKGLLVKPDDSYQAALATDDRRPLLDEITVNVNRQVYEQRWQRAKDKGWLGVSEVPAIRSAPAPVQSAEDGGTTVVMERERVDLDSLDLKGAAEQARAKREELEQRNRARRGEPEKDEFDAIIAASFDADPDPLPAEDHEEVPALLKTALRLCGEGDRVHYSAVADEVGLEAEEVRRLLRLIHVEPGDNSFRWNGTKARGYFRDQLEEAVAKIRRGELDVPPELRDAL